MIYFISIDRLIFLLSFMKYLKCRYVKKYLNLWYKILNYNLHIEDYDFNNND